MPSIGQGLVVANTPAGCFVVVQVGRLGGLSGVCGSKLYTGVGWHGRRSIRCIFFVEDTDPGGRFPSGQVLSGLLARVFVFQNRS